MTPPATPDIGYAVTAQLPGRYCDLTLYSVAAGDSKTPDEDAKAGAMNELVLLRHYVPDANFEITDVRRLT